MKYPHTLQQRLWTLRDVAIPIWPGYLYMRNKGASYKEAGCFAAAMCTIKLKPPDLRGTEKDVWDIIERYK